MEVEVSPETAEILFRVLTEERKENFELKRLQEQVETLTVRNDELERLNEYSDQEWRKEKEELFHVICRNTTQFFPDREGHKSPVELTLFGLCRHLVQTLDELKEHKKVNHRCQSIVLALGAIEKVDFTVHQRLIGGPSIAKKTGKITKIQDGILHVHGKGKVTHKIPITLVTKIEVAGKEKKK